MADTLLTTCTDSIITPLTAIRQQLVDLAGSWRMSTQRMHASAEQLQGTGTATKGEGSSPLSFAGKGADAFYAAVSHTETLVNTSLTSVDAVVYACDTCVAALHAATEVADSSHMSDVVLAHVLEYLTPQDIAEHGESAVVQATLAAGIWAINGLNRGDPEAVQNIPNGPAIRASIESTGDYLSGDGRRYLGSLPHTLQTWAQECHAAIRHLTTVLTQHQQIAQRGTTNVFQERVAAIGQMRIDWGFIRGRERVTLVATVPVPHTPGTHSGVTIGMGYDLGQQRSTTMVP